MFGLSGSAIEEQGRERSAILFRRADDVLQDRGGVRIRVKNAVEYRCDVVGALAE